MEQQEWSIDALAHGERLSIEYFETTNPRLEQTIRRMCTDNRGFELPSHSPTVLLFQFANPETPAKLEGIMGGDYHFTSFAEMAANVC